MTTSYKYKAKPALWNEYVKTGKVTPMKEQVERLEDAITKRFDEIMLVKGTVEFLVRKKYKKPIDFEKDSEVKRYRKMIKLKEQNIKKGYL